MIYIVVIEDKDFKDEEDYNQVRTNLLTLNIKFENVSEYQYEEYTFYSEADRTLAELTVFKDYKYSKNTYDNHSENIDEI